MEKQSDNQLMALVQGGDLSKVGTLYERHKEGLFSYFYRCTSDRMKSEDLVQNVFIRVINYRNQFKGKGEFSYWLYFLARNTWIDDYRKKDALKHSAEIENVGLGQMSNEDVENGDRMKEYKTQMKAALQLISPEKRDAIILSRYNGLTYKTIAEMSDCSENTIKARVMRGIKEIQLEIVKMNGV